MKFFLDHAAKASGPQKMDNPRPMIRNNNSRRNLESMRSWTKRSHNMGINELSETLKRCWKLQEKKQKNTPPKQTWNLKIPPLGKGETAYKLPILGFQPLIFAGCILFRCNCQLLTSTSRHPSAIFTNSQGVFGGPKYRKPPETLA